MCAHTLGDVLCVLHVYVVYIACVLRLVYVGMVYTCYMCCMMCVCVCVCVCVYLGYY